MRPPLRYGYANLVYYAFFVSQDLNDHQVCSFKVAISCNESSQWVAVEEIVSSHKNQTLEFMKPSQG